MKELIVSKKNNNKKLNTVILNEFPDLSLNTLNKTLRQKDIKVNGNRVNENILIHENDKISIYISDDYLFKNNTIDISELIVFEDCNILIINKPTGICIQKDTKNEICLEELLHDHFVNEKYIPKPCHRLDRNTSGLVIFAKNENALNEMLYCFKHRLISKYYKCLVYGIPSVKSNTLTNYLFKDSKEKRVIISDKKSKGYERIVTKYTLLEKDTNQNTSILEVELITGKTHQIRAHLAYINLPIIGDGKYGINQINKKFNKNFQCLCAYKLIFNTSNLDLLRYLDGKMFYTSANF